MNARYQALRLLQTRPPLPPTDQSRRPSEIFAEHVFTKKVMKHYLAKETYVALKETIEKGKILDKGIAGPVANSIKAWAMDKGATHFTHWFQPLTGRTAEKHDSFLELSGDDPIDKFSGSELSQQEPDASSFPSGGLRRTFEARGYTAWDCSSPIFIFETTYGKTLCIPTIFVSYTGEALDYKIPLLKSMTRLDKAATAVAKLFDPEVTRVTPTLGLEQEYFLIDRALFDLRPDLVLTGRTVFGAASARGQQLDDHYFGAIPERAFAFMNELEQEAHRLGIPLRTRHNEVAPGQFECAPQFEGLNIAIDHGLMVMDLIDRVARKHHLAALLHEKPFAGINGSGKHNNWSLSTDNGRNLLAPGHDPEENLMFLAFFTTVIRAVYEHADLLRAAIASAANDHRLGANEAPPAIISVFIGSRLSKILDDIENPPRRRKNEQATDLMHLGIAEIPELLLDNTDRNRTSPFAFTGNKFEFRAVGSSANSSQAMTILNIIVAEQLQDFYQKVERKINRGRKIEAAVLDIIREYIVESKDIRFEGDGYSQAWADEAARRGLSNVKQTPRALDFLLSDKARALFEVTGLFTEAELHARHEVQLENYLTKLTIEADIAEELARTKIIPAATDYLRELQATLPASAASDGPLAPLRELRDDLASRIGATLTLLKELAVQRTAANSLDTVREQAIAYGEQVLPVMQQIRSEVDQLELLVKDAYWPLPKYREMLFLR